MKRIVGHKMAFGVIVTAYIVFSGYSNDPILANYRDYGFAGVLVKPFRLEDMGSVIAEASRMKALGGGVRIPMGNGCGAGPAAMV